MSLRGADFGRAYGDRIDRWLTALTQDATSPESWAVVALGAYGRRELAPGSDLDVLLLHEPRSGRFGLRSVGVDTDEFARRLWYPIWDSGLRLDHSVRTGREALELADEDLRVALGLLDARPVAGNEELVVRLHERTLALWSTRLPRWMPELEAMIEARHERSSPVAFALEPDLKEGRGGLRDATILRGLALTSQVVHVDPTVHAAVDRLLDVRVGLHRVTGRSGDRLLLEHQDDVAALLRRDDADALLREVSAAARAISWHLSEGRRALRATIAGPPSRAAARPDVELGPGVVARDGEVVLDASTPIENAAAVLRVAAAAATSGLPIARTTLARLGAEVVAFDGPWPEEARRLFVALLDSGDRVAELVEDLEQFDLVGRLLPEWEAVRSRPQRNAFHRFTVDRHLVETVARLAVVAPKESWSGRRDLLVLGALLHDLGKGYPGDHTAVGVALVRQIATRMGFDDDDVDVLVDLVRHHLLLPSIATSRDLDEPATVERVATALGSTELLDLLHALTAADSQATGPAAWSTWKAGLLRTLVERVRARLEGSDSAAGADVLDDAELVARAGDGLVVEGSAHRLVVAAPDQPGLFSQVVGVLALHGHDVRGARARSVDGVAISEHDVVGRAGRAPDWVRFRHDLGEALAGRLDLHDRLLERARDYDQVRRPVSARPVESRVVVDDDASPAATVLEVHAADDLGVLHRITEVLATLGLDIRHAKVATLGPEVIDTFYVTRGGAKLAPDVAADVAASLHRALVPGAPAADSTGRIAPDPR